MKKILYFLVIVLFFAVSIWFVWINKDDAYDLESAIAVAEQGECDGYGTMTSGTYSEDYGLWYIEIDIPEEEDDYRFVYECEVNAYTGETKLVVDKAYDWYEGDLPDEVLGDDEVALTLEEAQLIAMSSDCTEIGRLTGEDDVYNSSTQTWWLGLDLFPEDEIEGCNPACVVYESDLHAEVNWRCTGLIE